MRNVLKRKHKQFMTFLNFSFNKIFDLSSWELKFWFSSTKRFDEKISFAPILIYFFFAYVSGDSKMKKIANFSLNHLKSMQKRCQQIWNKTYFYQYLMNKFDEYFFEYTKKLQKLWWIFFIVICRLLSRKGPIIGFLLLVKFNGIWLL